MFYGMTAVIWGHMFYRTWPSFGLAVLVFGVGLMVWGLVLQLCRMFAGVR
jgi:hypothetical protein